MHVFSSYLTGAGESSYHLVLQQIKNNKISQTSYLIIVALVIIFHMQLHTAGLKKEEKTC